MKTILVSVAGTNQTANAIDTGVALGRLLEAHVECLRVHPDPAQTVAQASAVDMGTSMIIGDLMQALQDRDKRETKRARDAFDAACAREKVRLADRPIADRGITASWREDTGDELSVLVARARFNDLTVIENPTSGAFPPGSAGAILIGSGRPLLVSPPTSPKSIASRVVIAWKNTAEAARAVTAALPILARAQTVVVLGVTESEDDEASLRLSLQNVTDYLAWHKIRAESRTVASAGQLPEDAMLAAMPTQDADLLVMGGYGHSRLRELVFGGFTRRVLKGVTFPVLLVH